MIFYIKQLEEASKNRPQGYKEDVLYYAKKIEEDKYELDDDSYSKLTEKYRLPTLLQYIKDISKSTSDIISNGINPRSESQIEQNLTICAKCPFLIINGFRCGKCGCMLNYKVLSNSWHCPINKW